MNQNKKNESEEKTMSEEFKNEEEQIKEIEKIDKEYELYDFSKLDRNVKKVTAENISKEELRALVDLYYQTQKQRIRIQNQIRAIEQNADDEFKNSADVLKWSFENEYFKEKQLADIFKYYMKTTKTGQWLSQIKGIGPRFAVVLLAYLDIDGKKAAGQFHSFCGLNDNNKPWYGKEKAKKIVNEVMGDEKVITFDHLMKLSEITGRSVSSLEKMSVVMDNKTHKPKLKNKKIQKTKDQLIKGLSMIPYNAFLKKTCYLISKSFVLSKNRGSLYGEIYMDRKAVETRKNEAGEFREQALRSLEEKNYTDKDAIETLKSGKLTGLHIENRARRYAVKLFISHLFEQMWIEEYGTEPPTPYIIEYGEEFEHNGYIEPEVPYIW